LKEVTLKEKITNLRELFRGTFALFLGDLAGTLGVLRADGLNLLSFVGIVSIVWLSIGLVFIWRRMNFYADLLEETEDGN
jgi:hypothetical protein